MIELRPPTKDDAAAIVQATQRFGFPDETAAEIESWLDNPALNIEQDARVALRDGSVMGYGDIGDRSGDGKVLWIDVRADPEGLATLLDFAEGRARELAVPGGKMKIWSPEENATWRALIESRGYAFDHFSRRMRIALDASISEPAWPEGIAVRTYRRDEDEEAVYEAHQEAFSDERDFERYPFDEWQHWSYRDPFDPDLWFLAGDRDQIAGISLCRPERGGDEEVGWVSVLAVRKPWRRQGLGSALLVHTFREFRKRGKRRAGLGVDADNEQALGLYERAGMKPERSFVWYEKAI